MFFNGKKHTFVIYNGKVVPPEWLFRALGQGQQSQAEALAVTLLAPAAVLTKTSVLADTQTVGLVLSDGTEHKLANATINGSTVELAAL